MCYGLGLTAGSALLSHLGDMREIRQRQNCTARAKCFLIEFYSVFSLWSLMSVTEKALGYSWKKERVPGCSWLLLILRLLLAVFEVFVDSVAQEGPNLAHEGTTTTSPEALQGGQE